MAIPHIPLNPTQSIALQQAITSQAREQSAEVFGESGELNSDRVAQYLGNRTRNNLNKCVTATAYASLAHRLEAHNKRGGQKRLSPNIYENYVVEAWQAALDQWAIGTSLETIEGKVLPPVEVKESLKSDKEVFISETDDLWKMASSLGKGFGRFGL